MRTYGAICPECHGVEAADTMDELDDLMRTHRCDPDVWLARQNRRTDLDALLKGARERVEEAVADAVAAERKARRQAHRDRVVASVLVCASAVLCVIAIGLDLIGR